MSKGLCVAVVHHRSPALLGLKGALDEPVLLGRGATFLGAGVFDDPRMSRNHARLSGRGDFVEVEDLGSRNGTFINGEKVPRGEARPGDVIGIGNLLLFVHHGSPLDKARTKGAIVGASSAVANLVEEIERIGPRASNVLVLGETGTGKELVARALHEASGRKGPFVSVNCGEVQDSSRQTELLEASIGGTLFLDEIGDATPAFQQSLLRVVQEDDLRIVAATHRDLAQLAQEGEFREDLYARLAALVIRVPPLRERLEDVPLIVTKLLTERLREKRPVHGSAMLKLLRYDYPSNVRELGAVVERMIVDTPQGATELRLSQALVPAPVRSAPGSVDTTMRAGCPPREQLQAMLDARQGNVTRLARDLSVARNTVYRWLKQHGIEVERAEE